MPNLFIDIKEVALKNNCPECYSNEGLRLKFKQKIKDTKYHKSITSKVKHEITCKTCNNIIYPVQWTEDIERVVEYHKKAFVPKQKSTFLKKPAWILIGIIIAISILFTAAILQLNL